MSRRPGLGPTEIRGTADGIVDIHLTITCPICDRPVDFARDDWGQPRQRRIVVACTGEPCGWAGTIVVDLIDLRPDLAYLRARTPHGLQSEAAAGSTEQEPPT